MPSSPFGSPSPFGGSRPFDGSSLLDRFHGKPVGEVRFPTAAAPPRPAVDPDYLRKVRENDPWPEGSSCAPPAPKPLVPPVAVALSNCRFLTPPDQLRLHEPFEMAVDVRRFAPGKTRRVFFSLHMTETRDGKDETHRIWANREGFPSSDASAHTVTAKGHLIAMGHSRIGERVRFQIEARHMEAPEPLFSQTIEVPLITIAHFRDIGGGDTAQHGIFLAESCFPRLGANAQLLRDLADVAAFLFSRRELPQMMVCTGHARTGGSATEDRSLSNLRARAIHAILAQDHRAWETLSGKHFATRDVQGFLADLHRACAWPCDPGAIDGILGPKTKSAIARFQREANERLQTELAEDGICGPRTWNAALRVLHALLHERLGRGAGTTPFWPVPELGPGPRGVFACGRDHCGYGSPLENTSVVIQVFTAGSAPRLQETPPGEPVGAPQDPTLDPSLYERRPIPLVAPGGTLASKIQTLELGIFFDGTGNNLRRDLQSGTETNVAKLYELHPKEIVGEVCRDKHYIDGIGTTGGWELLEQGLGWGLDDRINLGFKYLRDMVTRYPGANLRLRVFGFSRGAAAARVFVNRLHDPQWRQKFQLQDISFNVDLMGLFDTVVSVGLAGNAVDYDLNLEYRKFLSTFDVFVRPTRVDKVIHLISQLEVRGAFDLWSIRCPTPGKEVDTPWPILSDLPVVSKLPVFYDGGAMTSAEGWEECRNRTELPKTSKPENAWEEWILPGVHADVGGGYGPAEWIPAMPPLPHRTGETISEYVQRTLQTRLARGATPRDLCTNDPESRQQVIERMKQKDPAWVEFERRRKEQAAGDKTRLPEAQTQAPPEPAVHKLDNSLSRIALWVMIERTRRAGMKWKSVGEIETPRRPSFEKLPPSHPIFQYQQHTNRPEVLEELLAPTFEEFRTCVAHYIHDSRYMLDQGNRQRIVFFGGRNE